MFRKIWSDKVIYLYLRKFFGKFQIIRTKNKELRGLLIKSARRTKRLIWIIQQNSTVFLVDLDIRLNICHWKSLKFIICNNKIELFKLKLLLPPKPYIYDELCEISQDDSIGISAVKIKDVRALLRYLSPGGKKYYEDIFTKVPVKKSKWNIFLRCKIKVLLLR